ncbi:LOW QUALITY PROTEIN: Hypothetical protein PHPALM_1219 [Phytophthora palmivora]|uniref:Uncharacterized protein n=1 Tax=Phytophthora palmivora TaxID=4796 RepID=A0A2P4YSX0_9STRA|nr:LOW QUALITY PROTEIN: Hypothetical protein PHPALM_1219 [Phytophthora palmivora]
MPKVMQVMKRKRMKTMKKSRAGLPELVGEVGELSLQVGRMGVPRPVEQNLAAEIGEDADDEDQGVAQGERPPLSDTNADTPNADKVLAQLGGEMIRDSEWMKLFAPVPLAQARWPSLGPLLAGRQYLCGSTSVLVGLASYG